MIHCKKQVRDCRTCGHCARYREKRKRDFEVKVHIEKNTFTIRANSFEEAQMIAQRKIQVIMDIQEI